jgi:hypothetical protein
MTPHRRCLVLRKGREHFVFTYVDGRESDLLAALVCYADDPENSLDWFDAAALTFQIAHPVKAEADSAVTAVMGQRL